LLTFQRIVFPIFLYREKYKVTSDSATSTEKLKSALPIEIAAPKSNREDN
jgi:hypothetical protein